MDDESKLTLHGLVQHYIMLHEEEKNRKLTDLLDALDFNQVGFTVLQSTAVCAAMVARTGGDSRWAICKSVSSGGCQRASSLMKWVSHAQLLVEPVEATE